MPLRWLAVLLLVGKASAYTSALDLAEQFVELEAKVEANYDLHLLPEVKAQKQQAKGQGQQALLLQLLLLEGSIVQHYGDYERGLELHKQALQLANQLGDAALKVKAYLAIAHLDIDLENLKHAQDYLNKATQLAAQLHTANQLKAQVALWQARLYVNKGAYRLALQHSNINLQKVDNKTANRIRLTRAQAYLELGQYPQAEALLAHIGRSESVAQDQQMRITNALLAARVQLQAGEFTAAIDMAEQGLQETLGTRFLQQQSQLQWTLASAYAQLGNYAEGYRFLKRFSLTKRALNLQKRNNKLLKLEAQYALAQQQQAVSELERDNAIQAKQILAHQQQLENAQLTQQRWLLVAVLALTLVLVFYWRWQNRRYTKLLEQQVAQRTEELAERNQRLQTLSFTDSLTGLSNRHHFFSVIDGTVAAVDQRVQQAGPDGRSDLVFAIIDIDHFKTINDSYGHAAGDIVLQDFAAILKQCTRESDLLVRWGGEEFLLVMNGTERQRVATVIERIRQQVESYPFMVNDQPINCSCSIGFAAYPFNLAHPQQLSWEQVLEVADAGLYVAKASQRNAWVEITAGNTGALSAEQLVKQAQRLLQQGQLKANSNLKALQFD
ncbi:GGDEF domain-containing protein [Pseudoalteromonas 'SMAR']|uniref:GGDEF domain-containing protein n=1 Tax=Pseudoalteromonas 'SMAR' TaxID=3416908 RepID=UPI003AF2ED3F